MVRTTDSGILTLALPKGRMQEGVFALMRDAGMEVKVGSRGYRPAIALPGVEAKILKPQNIIEMLAAGSRDIGFAGADWVAELQADLVEVLDTGLDRVRLVAAAPADLLVNDRLPDRPIVVASEYERLTKQWITSRGLRATFVRSYGATEVFPPEDADCIVDIAASGDTLRANNLEVFDELTTSSTRVYANKAAWNDPRRREVIDRFALLVNAALEARRRVMVEVNVSAADLERVIEVLPCMREPTVAKLHHEGGFAVKAAVPKKDLAVLVPQIKARGGTDIVVLGLAQIIP